MILATQAGLKEVTMLDGNLNHYIQPLHALGDIESLVKKFKSKSIFMAISGEQSSSVNLLCVRLALDANILSVPRVDPDIPNLNLYYRHLPSRAIIYAMKGSVLINYSMEALRRDWNNLFSENPLYMGLAQRYATPRQALTEFHFWDNSPIVPALQMKLYGRTTAHSLECILRAIFGAAIAKSFPDFFENKAKLIAIK